MQEYTDKQMHKGKIVKETLLNIGIPFAVVAKKMGVSRSTLYKRFTDPDMDDAFIINMSHAIQYDFSVVLPHLSNVALSTEDEVTESRSSLVYRNRYMIKLEKLKANCIHLLEAYNKSLLLLLEIANKNTFTLLNQKINTLVIELKEIEKKLVRDDD